MATNDSLRKRARRSLGIGAILVGALAVLALGPLGVAGAQDTEPARDAKPGSLTSQQKQCLEDRVLTFLQDRSGQPISLALLQAVGQSALDVAKACDVTLPRKARSVQGALSRLGVTLDQVQCVLSKGVPLPQVGPGQKPSVEALQAVRSQLVAAAQSCGITVPPKLAGPTTISPTI